MTSNIYDKQTRYYTETAQKYAQHHVSAGDEHSVALEYMAQIFHVVGVRSVLDVGAGTGRAVRYLRQVRDDLEVTGIEPVAALREEARTLGTELGVGYGERLPFDDDAFDAVIATGVMHHVERPVDVLREMVRVARKAVMISDSNRFGQGSALAKLVKLGVHSLGAWHIYNWVRTKGKGYMESEGDGLFYSYSVYDSLPSVHAWADRAFVIPTSPARSVSRMGPLWDSSHALLVGLKEPAAIWNARRM